jgi:putative transcriptional regulator
MTIMTNDPSFRDFVAAHAGDPAVALFAQTAAAVRTDARFIRREDDVASAAFLADETPAPMAADALDRVLGQIDQAADRDRRAVAATRDHGPRMAELAGLPSPLREAALEALKRHGWSFGGFGIRRLALITGDGSEAELMRIQPGFGAAPHDHAADELTLIVTGAYHDGHDRYEPGDVTLAQPGFSHSPTAEPGEICYVLAVTYGPPKFLGAFGVLQKILGFPWPPKT